MRHTSRTALATLTFALSGSVTDACDIIYPEDYVEPTIEQLVAGSDMAFVGRVVGYRFDDGTILEHDITCDDVRDDAFQECWAQRGRIVNAILSVDAPVRGMEDATLFEDTTSAEGGADCGNEYDEDSIFLVTDFMGGQIVVARYLATRLEGPPTRAQLAQWRALPRGSSGK